MAALVVGRRAAHRFYGEQALRGVVIAALKLHFFFGISDVIESRTGAWCQPFWLLILKVACLAAFLFGFREYYKVVKAQKRDLAKRTGNSPSH